MPRLLWCNTPILCHLQYRVWCSLWLSLSTPNAYQLLQANVHYSDTNLNSTGFPNNADILTQLNLNWYVKYQIASSCSTLQVWKIISTDRDGMYPEDGHSKCLVLSVCVSVLSSKRVSLIGRHCCGFGCAVEKTHTPSWGYIFNGHLKSPEKQNTKINITVRSQTTTISQLQYPLQYNLHSRYKIPIIHPSRIHP